MNLSEKRVLVLNRAWQAIGIKSIQQALVDLAGGEYTALDFTDGGMVPVNWEKWITLAPINEDEIIRTSSRLIRMPTVLIACHYSRVPKRRPKFTLGNIAKRDGRRCQYTGRELTRDRWSLDHVVPLSRGGSNTPDNVVLCDKDVNNFKGARTPQEAGLPVPTIRRLPDFDQIEASHPHHELFLAR